MKGGERRAVDRCAGTVRLYRLNDSHLIYADPPRVQAKYQFYLLGCRANSRRFHVFINGVHK